MPSILYTVGDARQQDSMMKGNGNGKRYKTEISHQTSGKYIKRYLPPGENGAVWDSTLRLAPSLGTLATTPGSTHGGRGTLLLDDQASSPQTLTACSLAPIWQADGASNKSYGFIEHAVQRTYDQWFKPKYSRDASIQYLKKEPAGGFVVRTSTRYPGFYGLSIKSKEMDLSQSSSVSADQSIRHYLIGETPEGHFQIQGTEAEPKFRSLTELIIYHCQYSGALPCVLCLPGYTVPSPLNRMHSDTFLPPNRYCETDNIEFQVLYLATIDVFSLTGTNAICSAMDVLCRSTQAPNNSQQLRPNAVAFRVSQEGVTLTDLHCRQFLRRHFGPDCFVYCGVDPYGRTLMENNMDNWNSPGRKIFGFIVRSSDVYGMHSCHLFAQQFNTQPCEFIVETVKKMLIQDRTLYGLAA